MYWRAVIFYVKWHTCLRPNYIKTIQICCTTHIYIAVLRRQCQNSQFVVLQKKILKVLKCCDFLCVQRQHNRSPAANFANCVMTLYLVKSHLQEFLSISIIKKFQILRCDTLVANERCVYMYVCIYIYIYISLFCEDSVKIQNLWFCRRRF